MSKDSLSNFKIIKQIGEGSYGNVYTVKHISTGDLYVLKRVNTSDMSRSEILDAENEFIIHQALRHPNMQNYKKSLFMILEYMEGGDLGQYIEKHKRKHQKITEIKIWNFFIQACLGIQYLHSQRILHRDLKSSNLFLSKKGQLKIGDLGVAKQLNEKYTKTIVGTPYYLAPELCEEKPYNNKSDIWSLGSILYEMCTLNHPFEAKTIGGLYLKIIRSSYEPISSFYSQELADIIESCLQKNFEDRPSIEDILQNCKLQEMAEKLSLSIPSTSEVLNNVENRHEGDFMTTYKKRKIISELRKASTTQFNRDNQAANHSIDSGSEESNNEEEVENSKSSFVVFKICKNLDASSNNFQLNNCEDEESPEHADIQDFEIIHKKPTCVKPIKIEPFEESPNYMKNKQLKDKSNDEEHQSKKIDFDSLLKKNYESAPIKDKRAQANFHKISPMKNKNIAKLSNLEVENETDFSILNSNLNLVNEAHNKIEMESSCHLDIQNSNSKLLRPSKKNSFRKYTQDYEQNIVNNCMFDFSVNISTKDSENNSFKDKFDQCHFNFAVSKNLHNTEQRPLDGDCDCEVLVPADSVDQTPINATKIKDETDNEDISIGTDEDDCSQFDSSKQIADFEQEDLMNSSKNDLKAYHLKLSELDDEIKNQWKILEDLCNCEDAKKSFEFFKDNAAQNGNQTDRKTVELIENFLKNLNIINFEGMVCEMTKLLKMETNYDQCKAKMIELI